MAREWSRGDRDSRLGGPARGRGARARRAGAGACGTVRAAPGRPAPVCPRAPAVRRDLRTSARDLGRARLGEHVVVTTGTASGKTLAFNLPILDAIARDPKLRTLYLYPTKALAQDQARSLAAFKLPRTRAAIYDGDTPGERRWQIRKWANLILTNPDMLHVGVLPHHDRWGDVLSNLRYVVVDEAHVYRGVFGSHVGNVLRRLRRLARVYGSEPQFLLASATIANPGELAQRLLGLDVTVVDEDAAPAPSGRSHCGTRRSSTTTSASARPRSARRRGCTRRSSAAACARSSSRNRGEPPN